MDASGVAKSFPTPKEVLSAFPQIATPGTHLVNWCVVASYVVVEYHDAKSVTIELKTMPADEVDITPDRDFKIKETKNLRSMTREQRLRRFVELVQRATKAAIRDCELQR